MVGPHQRDRKNHQVSDALLLVAAILGVAAASFLVARSPSFWIGLVKVVVTALLPKLLKAIRPKNFTKKQRDQIARGEDPFSIRPFGRQKGE
jgi:Flp pilus assembly protein TadB